MMRLWDTPLPIPNRLVKTQTADDTWWEAAWESKWLPDSISGCSVAWLARLIWDQEVAGSNPVTPIVSLFTSVVGIAQLVRAPDCGSGGREFESHYPPQNNMTH